MKINILFLALLIPFISTAQQEKEELPYYELPEYSEEYTAGTVAARQVDALGFRFYWSTEGLTEKDLVFKPNDSVRTTGETIDHIYDMSKIIVNATLNQKNSREKEVLTFEEKRKNTLINLKTAAENLRASDDISQFKIIFGSREIPYWNNINGPISDCIWHCGQIASFRRSSGNPIPKGVNHFMGTVKK